MKRFVTRILMFLMLLLLVMAGGEALVRHYPNSYSLKAKWMDAHSHEVRTLVMGNSHNYYGINPAVLGAQSFNLANVSQNPEYDWFLLKKYYGDDIHKLQNVLIAVDFTRFFDGPLEEDEWGRAIYYRLYMGYNKHGFLSRYAMEWCCLPQFNKKFTAAVRYLFTGQAQVNCDSLGFGITTTPPEEVTNASLQASADRVMAHYGGIRTDYVNYNLQYLDSIAAFCRHNGIGLIVVAPPVWDGFYKRIGERERLLLADAFDRLQTEGAECHDYACDPRFAAIDNFSDCSHLSRKGADMFTKILMEDFPQLRHIAVNPNNITINDNQ